MKKLDKWLDLIAGAIETMLRWLLVVLAIIVLIEQVCMVAEQRPAQLISLMFVLIVILSAFGIREIKNMKKEKENK